MCQRKIHLDTLGLIWTIFDNFAPYEPFLLSKNGNNGPNGPNGLNSPKWSKLSQFVQYGPKLPKGFLHQKFYKNNFFKDTFI